MNENPENESASRRLGLGGWFALLVLAAFLIAAIAYAIHVWDAMPGVAISTNGWIAMVLGAVFTLAVGGGLMALVFYSSRNNYDQ